MEQPVILSKLEQEYLLRAIESAAQVRDARQLFLWAQGQLQGLLPHQLMVAMQFDEQGTLLRAEPLHGTVLDEAQLRALCEARSGLGPRLAMWAGARQLFPCAAQRGGQDELPAPLRAAIDACPYDNLLAHGSGAMPGGATAFVLFGLPQRPGPRQAYFLELLLPYLHLALLRTCTARAAVHPNLHDSSLRALSEREVEILIWVRQGKSNADIAAILGLSALTVKNHLHRIYKTLSVANRTQAVARSAALRLLPEHASAAC